MVLTSMSNKILKICQWVFRIIIISRSSYIDPHFWFINNIKIIIAANWQSIKEYFIHECSCACRVCICLFIGKLIIIYFALQSGD